MIRPVRDRERPVDPAISVVIPVLDGGVRLGHALDALRRQHTTGAVELVVVDSGSRDGSRERALGAGARLFELAGPFGHGRTRNDAVAVARAPVVVLLSQDAVPRGEAFLETLTGPLRRDPRLAGAYARQVPPPGADPLVRAALERWTPAGVDRRLPALSPAAARRLDPAALVRRCRFDDVASCVRRAVWERHPFPDLPFGEDVVWARDVLLAGHELLYRAAAEVEHAHVGGARAAYRRDRAAHELLARHFGLRTVPHPAAGVAAWIVGWGSDWRDLRAQGVPPRRRPVGLVRGARRRAGALAGQLLGGRAGLRGGGPTGLDAAISSALPRSGTRAP